MKLYACFELRERERIVASAARVLKLIYIVQVLGASTVLIFGLFFLLISVSLLPAVGCML